MTQPKYIVPGQVVLTTRRCSERRFFLKPAKWLREATGYLIAVLAPKYHIGVHAASYMSNHGHQVLTDHMGLRPKFFQELRSHLARIVNDMMRRTGAVWDNREPGDCVLMDDEAVLDELLYVCTNPVHHGLVRDRREWKGFGLGPQDWGVCHSYSRPSFFSSTNEDWPEMARLKTTPPKALVRLARADGAQTDDEIRAWAIAKVDARQEEIVAERLARGRGFLSMLRVQKTSRWSAPKRPGQHSTLNPRIATKDATTMIAAKKALRHFRKRYRDARRQWCDGELDTIFPKGTYWYKHHSPAATADDTDHVLPAP